LVVVLLVVLVVVLMGDLTRLQILVHICVVAQRGGVVGRTAPGQRVDLQAMLVNRTTTHLA
jgi:hypothetical protein